jgi:hypothetical protein
MRVFTTLDHPDRDVSTDMVWAVLPAAARQQPDASRRRASS